MLVGNQLLIPTPGAVAGIILGGDANLYRASADVLATDDRFAVGSGLLFYPATFGIMSINTPGTNPLLRNFLVSGDANPTFQLRSDGRHEWGPGGATAVDTSLYRYAADVLATDDQFRSVGGPSQIGFCYYPASALGQALGVYVAGEAQRRFSINVNGQLDFGPGGATAPDTNLYRAAADTLQTDDQFVSLSQIWSAYGSAAQVSMGARGPAGVAGIAFGSANDTNLYRQSAGNLKTDTGLLAGQNITARHGAPAAVALGNVGPAGEAAAVFGSAVDTNLYRAAADVLATDDAFQPGRMRMPALAAAPASPVQGEMYFNTTDKNMYYYNGTAWVSTAAGGTGSRPFALFMGDI